MAMALTKRMMAEQVSAATGLCVSECLIYIEDTLELIKQALERGETVKITNFGTFKILNKKEREGRNLKTGETVTIKSRKVVSFAPSPGLRSRLK